jgi:hypothetical protein
LLFYDGPPVPFASEFLAKALQRFPVPELEMAMGDRNGAAKFAGGAGGVLLDQVIGWSTRPADATDRAARFDFWQGGSGIDLLGPGWSFAENWGTWSAAPRAELRLPLGGKRGRRKAIVTFQVFGKERARMPLEVTLDSSPQKFRWLLPTNVVVRQELSVESAGSDVMLAFACPDAVSPSQLGLNDDPRRLGIGLISLDLTETA